MTPTPTSGAADLPEARLFTKKPVTIAAIQWTGKNLREVIAFTDSSPDTRTTHAGMAWEAYTDLVARDGLKIYTLEGTMLASPGDWIILGVKGEYYPCKPDIFEATYSPAALAAGQATAAQGVAYADAHGAIMGAAYDFRDAHISGGPNQKRSAHAALESAVTHALRASHGQAPAQPAPQQEAQEPVAWQSRTRPTWGGNDRPWSPWEPCTKGQAEDCWKTPLLHEWAYEARALYTAPQPSPAAQGDENA